MYEPKYNCLGDDDSTIEVR